MTDGFFSDFVAARNERLAVWREMEDAAVDAKPALAEQLVALLVSQRIAGLCNGPNFRGYMKDAERWLK